MESSRSIVRSPTRMAPANVRLAEELHSAAPGNGAPDQPLPASAWGLADSRRGFIESRCTEYGASEVDGSPSGTRFGGGQSESRTKAQPARCIFLRPSTGFGLGLTLVGSIAAVHGGSGLERPLYSCVVRKGLRSTRSLPAGASSHREFSSRMAVASRHSSRRPPVGSAFPVFRARHSSASSPVGSHDEDVCLAGRTRRSVDDPFAVRREG